MTGGESVWQDRDGRYAVEGNRWDLLETQPGRLVDVSVIIPYFDNQEGLQLVLAGLSVQHRSSVRTQVIVADDGSAVPPAVAEYAGLLDISVVRQPDEGFRPGTARNLGVRHADGEVLVFLDGDTVPGADYLDRLARLPSLLPDAVVGGRRRHVDFTGWTPAMVRRWLTGHGPDPAELTEPRWLTDEYGRSNDLLDLHAHSYKFMIGAVLACHREIFHEVGGFDESIVGYGGEDYDFTYRAYNNGAVLAYVPGAVAWHQGPDWSGRSADHAAQRRQKNVETMMLAQRIPEPSARGRGQFFPVPDLLVSLEVTGWSVGAAVLCLRSLLDAADCRIWLTGTGSAPTAIADCFASDPRVDLGEPAEYLQQRSRARMHCGLPVIVNDGFVALLDEMHGEDLGEVRIVQDVEVLATIESTRAIRRGHRWAARGSSPGSVRLFGAVTVPAPRAGFQPIPEEPSLAAVFGGWQ